MLMVRPIASFLLAGLLASATGCWGSWEQARYTRDVEVTFPIPAESGLAVTSKNGSISLTDAERADVWVQAHIKATSQERADAVRITATEADGWLEIGAEWPTPREGSEGVSFTIEGDGRRAARLRTSNGSLHLEGFTGEASLDTSNGSIVVVDHTGPLDLDSSNGRITVNDARDAVVARTSNGAISVELADAATAPVDLRTSNGAVTLTVGPSFAGRIDTDTSNSAVTLDAAGGSAVTLHGDRTEKLIQVRGGDERSTIRSSNGSIRVKVRNGEG